MRTAWARPVSASLAPLALALLGGGLSYWSAARTPLRPVSSSLNATAESLTALFALCAAALAVLGVLVLLDAFETTPIQVRRYARLAAGLPLWILALPIALSASYVAARIGLSPNPDANFWPAFWLWPGAIALFIVAFLPQRWWGRLRLRVPRPMWSRILLSEVVVIGLLAAVSLTLRAVKLNAAPFLTSVDEEAIRPDVVASSITNMFSTGWSSVPGTYFFAVAGAFKVFGTGVVAVRMVSALVGAAAVVVTYLLLRDVFGRAQGLIGALFMSGYHLHLHFSRAGLINGWDTLAAASALYFAYRASRGQRTFDFAALGLVCGLTLYAYVSASAVPLIVIAYLIYVSIIERGFLRTNLAKILLSTVTFILAAMPMGAYYLTHPDTFTSGPSSRLLFHSAWYEQQLELGRSVLSILWDQALHAFGGFVYYPMSPAGANLYDAPHPLIPGLAAVPFVAGFVYSILHIEKKEYGLLLLGFAVPAVLGGVLTYPPIQWQRFLATIPAVSGLIAVGLWQLTDRLLAWRRSLVPLVAFPAVIFLGAQNIDLYFQAAVNDVTFGAPIRYVTTRYVKALPEDTRIYWFGAPDIGARFVALSLPDRQFIEVFDPDPKGLPPVDSPSPSVYLFAANREAELPPLRAKCPGGVTKTLSFRGDKILAAYELMADNTCTPTLEPPPVNDKFAGSTVVASLPFSDTISTKAATLEPSEPQPGPAPGDKAPPCSGVNNTAWYSFTPENDMTLVAKAAGSSADAVLAVYEGSSLASLTSVGCSAHLPNRSARVEFTARAGVTYHFQVAALSFSVGTVTFSLERSSPPRAPLD